MPGSAIVCAHPLENVMANATGGVTEEHPQKRPDGIENTASVACANTGVKPSQPAMAPLLCSWQSLQGDPHQAGTSVRPSRVQEVMPRARKCVRMYNATQPTAASAFGRRIGMVTDGELPHQGTWRWRRWACACLLMNGRQSDQVIVRRCARSGGQEVRAQGGHGCV